MSKCDVLTFHLKSYISKALYAPNQSAPTAICFSLNKKAEKRSKTGSGKSEIVCAPKISHMIVKIELMIKLEVIWFILYIKLN